MLFEISVNDLNSGKKILSEFAKKCESEYETQIKNVKNKIKNFNFLSNTNASNIVSDEAIFLVYSEKDKLYLRTSIYLPFKLNFFIKRKLCKNIKRFLESNGLKVNHVKIVGD